MRTKSCPRALRSCIRGSALLLGIVFMSVTAVLAVSVFTRVAATSTLA